MIASDITPALAELQAQAESLMTTPCQVVRPTGVTAGPRGEDVVTSDPVYTGGCKLQAGQTQTRDAESGLGTIGLQQAEVHLPVAAGPFRPGDVVAAQGRSFRVLGLPTKTWQTAQRLPVEEVF